MAIQLTIWETNQETTLGQVKLELDKGMIARAMEKNKIKISPKYRAFQIFKKNIGDVAMKSTLIWNSIYGLSNPTITKKGEQEKKELAKNVEGEKDKDEKLVKKVDVQGTKGTKNEATTKDE